MINDPNFRPDWASAPGETIADLLAERHISISGLAEQLGQTTNSVHELLQGRAAITLATARSLRRVFGASVEFWMSRDLQYRDDVAKLDEINQEWLAQLPVGDMIRFGWLRPIPHPSNELADCFRFFGVSSVREWNVTYSEIQQRIAFRTSPSYDSQPGRCSGLAPQGEIQGRTTECAPWMPRDFRPHSERIRTLSRIKDPALFLPRLREYCAENGVAVSVVRAPTGCKASGATRFLPSGHALLLLSFRYLTDDHFWFTFFTKRDTYCFTNETSSF